MYTIIIPVDTNVERGERATRRMIELIENGPMTDVDAISVTLLNVFKEFRIEKHKQHHFVHFVY